MGLGLLKLVAIGKENIILNKEPQITFFKKNIKKINIFSNENIPQYFKSIPTFGRRMTLNISKIGDLINDITLFVELQEIPPSNHSSLPDNVKQFAWVNKIGLQLIKYIDIEIDGILIERHYNDFLNIYYETELINNNDLDKVIGNKVKVLTEYSNGKKNYKLYIPLRFFFNLDKFLALPIISLSKQDIKIHLEMNSFNKCYKETPTHYFEISENICLFQKDELIEQSIDGIKVIAKFKHFDNLKKRVYYEYIYNTFTIPNETNKSNTKYNITGRTSNYKINPKYDSIIVKDESYFYTGEPPLKDAHVIVNYIFLDAEEKFYFQNTNHTYIVPMVQNILDKDITSVNNHYKLNLTNPHKILFWRALLDSNKIINDNFNYTSLPLTENKESLINKVKLYINSIPRIDIDNYEFYTYLNNYVNKFKSNNDIYSFTFCDNPKSNIPNGTFNFSRIDDAYLQLNLNKLVSFQNPINVRLYGIYFNILVIENGTSSLKFIN
jgi:hypothetical protein